MNNVSTPIKFCLVNPGTMGEQVVLKALLGPQIQFSEITLDGFETHRQPRPPKDVWGVIKEAWNDKGDPHPGAYGLVEKEGAQATVGCVTFSSQQEVRDAVTMLDEWNFHDRKTPKEGWFRYKSIKGLDMEGNPVVYITEILTGKGLKLVEPDYRETPKYKKAVGVMARQAGEFREAELRRRVLEGEASSGERATGSSSEVKV